MKRTAAFFSIHVWLLAALSLPAATNSLGQRPYEMDWAGRTNDPCPPMVDFEAPAAWRVEAQGAVATLERSREQQIWGQYVGKLTYRSTNRAPEIRLLPAAPLPIRSAFDAISLWVYGNNWGYAPNPATPPVTIAALFLDSAQKEFAVSFHPVDWTGWHLLHRRLAPDQIARVQAGAQFAGLRVTNGRNPADRVIYLDNFAVFTESFAPLTFEPRPARGIPMFPGQAAGANIGPGTLPFPTRAETILPTNLAKKVKTSLTSQKGAYTFRYQGSDGQLEYRYRPQAGTWSDLEAEWRPASTKTAPKPAAVTFRPCVDGGVYLLTAKGPVLPEKAVHLGTQARGDRVESRWQLSASNAAADVTYVFRLWQKSLVIDVLAPGGQVAEVRFGKAAGLAHPRLVTNPFYPAHGGRPAVVVSGPETAPLFLAGNVDWYLSNASILWAANQAAINSAVYHGGTRYLPLTNGRRNDAYERFFLTASPVYEETLPTIANPPSPWRHITGTRLWRAHGASNREQDRQYWENVHRYGMTAMIVTDHETMWRDDGESFTFRTRTAPGKGGDAGARDYARFLQDQLGFVYGPYNNYTDFAPVNEFWDFDLISRTSGNQLQTAWMRCYAPKPARAVEYCARLAPQIQEKFHFSTAYCDVHTAVPPWDRVDYDARVPGAGTFAAVYYAFGEIMLHQKRAWSGPVYSEGNYHCFYQGLTDGNYGQDQNYRPAENPWLVDFDLRKLHDLGCNFGMGNLEMFYANQAQPRSTPAERDAELDRFLAATVAFGHPGFLVMEHGRGGALRSYYMLQQLHSRYCLTNAAEIAYVAEDGALQDTSRAVVSGAFRRSQVVTRYAGGTITAANGSKTQRLKTRAFGRDLDLPPNGYAGWTSDGAIEVLSSDRQGQRCDYAATPAYLYADGRGKFTRFARAASQGIGICRILSPAEWEIIPYQGTECGFAITATAATALDKQGKTMGPAALRASRGLAYVEPVAGAFSYRLTGNPGAPANPLRCVRDEVVPGEHVTIQGRERHEAIIPATSQPGQRIWLRFEDAWIDFTVAPLADLHLALEDDQLVVTATSHLQQPADFAISVGGAAQTLRLAPQQPALARFPLGAPKAEGTETMRVTLRSGELIQERDLRLRTARETVLLSPWSAQHTSGICLRGQDETGEMGSTGATVDARRTACSGVEKNGLFMHPPYQGGVGYVFALSEILAVPAQPAAVFRALVGKADGSDPGDGILYKLAVRDSTGRETVVAQATVREHAWQAIEADLSRWAGQRVQLKLIADVGPANNPNGDWACWADPRCESREPVLHRRLEQ